MQYFGIFIFPEYKKRKLLSGEVGFSLKISVINGSPRVNGSTGKILKEISGYLKTKENVEVLYFNISKLEIEMCKGCAQCYETGVCVISQDGIESIVQDIKDSDVRFLGSGFTL